MAAQPGPCFGSDAEHIASTNAHRGKPEQAMQANGGLAAFHRIEMQRFPIQPNSFHATRIVASMPLNIHGAVGIGDETILVQTSAMKHCEIDVLNRTARVGAGARWQDVIAAAAPHGLAPLCGSSPSVGVVGFLTGGGIGPLVRTVGLSSDHVRAFDVVNNAEKEPLHLLMEKLKKVRGKKRATIFGNLR